MSILLAVIISYLIGSIPTAFIFGKIYKGIDIRDHGSGNVGATNAFRVLGKFPGTLVLIIDIIKGVIALTLVAAAFQLDDVVIYVILGVAAVVGHNWTIFLHFKGGKGIATSLGVLIGLTIKISVLRPVLLISVIFWIIVFVLSGYVSLASIMAAIILPITMIVSRQTLEIVGLGIIFCVFIVYRHRTNIARLLQGNESRVNFPFRSRKS